jgi:hypothetical protein
VSAVTTRSSKIGPSCSCSRWGIVFIDEPGVRYAQRLGGQAAGIRITKRIQCSSPSTIEMPSPPCSHEEFNNESRGQRPGSAGGRPVKPRALPDDAPKQVSLNAVIEERCMKTDGTAQWLHEHKGIAAILIAQPIDEAERGRRKKERARGRRLRRQRNAQLRKIRQLGGA